MDIRNDCAINGFEVARLWLASCAMVTLGRTVLVLAMTLNNFCKMLAAASEDMVEGFFNGLTVML